MICGQLQSGYKIFERISSGFIFSMLELAERVGFEPTVGVNLHTLSKRAP